MTFWRIWCFFVDHDWKPGGGPWTRVYCARCHKRVLVIGVRG